MPELSFSQRIGIEPIEKPLQIDSMSENLRTRLWNALFINYFAIANYMVNEKDLKYYYSFEKLCANYLYQSTEEFYNYEMRNRPNYKENLMKQKIQEIRGHLNKCNWNEVYELIENIIKYFGFNYEFVNECNTVLEQENSAYRLVDNKFVQITNETELSEITEALKNKEDKFGYALGNLRSALEKFADKTNPNYRNTVSEAISAVEGVCQIILGKKETLGDAIKKLQKQNKINEQFKIGLEKIYAYAHEARHASDKEIEFDEAKFMLVFCSAVVNYLIAKETKANSLSTP